MSITHRFADHIKILEPDALNLRNFSFDDVLCKPSMMLSGGTYPLKTENPPGQQLFIFYCYASLADRIDDIIRYVFQYIKLLQKEGAQEWIFKEIQVFYFVLLCTFYPGFRLLIRAPFHTSKIN